MSKQVDHKRSIYHFAKRPDGSMRIRPQFEGQQRQQAPDQNAMTPPRMADVISA